MPEIKITWLGHATVLIDAGDFTLLTDPVLVSKFAHLRRRVPAPNIERVDAILISHVHMDHLHTRSLRLVSDSARVITPLGSERIVKRTGATSIDPVVPGDHVDLIAGIDVEVVRAEHDAKRGPHSAIRAQPVGYVVEVREMRIYFAGDTDLFDEMHHLGPIDVALLPIWGWGSTLGGGHLDPARAATAASWIQPRFVMPIHWGTYSPIQMRRNGTTWLNDPIDTFREALSDYGMEDRLVADEPGSSMRLTLRGR